MIPYRAELRDVRESRNSEDLAELDDDDCEEDDLEFCNGSRGVQQLAIVGVMQGRSEYGDVLVEAHAPALGESGIDLGRFRFSWIQVGCKFAKGGKSAKKH
ncbi:hypothetical protein L1987_59493 [Smallanthus sonchifolius]|uniref:Uncharacterized protein n=1 Tax=Smallanthus sonchifolius TaxID=185202 RepID=A0ACB9D5U8_9ASTR|nr:hypothetical protein L1987_59493 [Smallanthus sonchifolius]